MRLDGFAATRWLKIISCSILVAFREFPSSYHGKTLLDAAAATASTGAMVTNSDAQCSKHSCNR